MIKAPIAQFNQKALQPHTASTIYRKKALFAINLVIRIIIYMCVHGYIVLAEGEELYITQTHINDNKIKHRQKRNRHYSHTTHIHVLVPLRPVLCSTNTVLKTRTFSTAISHQRRPNTNLMHSQCFRLRAATFAITALRITGSQG